MTVFVVGCVAMVLAALAWVTLPLWRPDAAIDVDGSRKERRTAGAIVVVVVSAVAGLMYWQLSNWSWNAADVAADQSATVAEMLGRLEAKLKADPSDVEGWLMLGRSNFALERFAPAVDAYQHAYDLTHGQNVDAIIGLGESMALLDETALTGRAGQLFEAALALAPDNPKALWYGSVAALQSGNVRLGRDRLQALLAQNPPAQLRSILERQVQALNEELGEEPSSAAAATTKKVIQITVTVAPAIQQQLKGPTPLFILARDPAGGGPPLAVQRHSSTELPLSVELSAADAMMPTRTIDSVPRVTVVARLSLSGAPLERSGDFFGEADYDFAKDTGTLQILIDRTVP